MLSCSDELLWTAVVGTVGQGMCWLLDACPPVAGTSPGSSRGALIVETCGTFDGRELMKASNLTDRLRRLPSVRSCFSSTRDS